MGHSTSSGRGAGGTSRTEQELREAIRNGDLDTAIRIQNSVERNGRLVTAEERREENLRRASFEDEIDRATFSGNGNIRSFQIPGIGAAQVRAGRDEFGNHGWVASVATPNSNLAPINGGRAFSSREQAEAMARDRLKNRVRFLRQEAREERAAMEARERSQSSANRPLIPPVGRTSTRRSGIRRRSGGGFET